jgi:hypothetical protein
MPARAPGYYWVTWSERADAEFAARRPGPLIGHWDGGAWWFIRCDAYRFDCEVEVLGKALAPPQPDFTASPVKLRAVEK